MKKKNILLFIIFTGVISYFMFGPISNIVLDTYEKYILDQNDPNDDYFYSDDEYNNDVYDNYYENNTEEDSDEILSDEDLEVENEEENGEDEDETLASNNTQSNTTINNSNTTNKKPSSSSSSNSNTKPSTGSATKPSTPTTNPSNPSDDEEEQTKPVTPTYATLTVTKQSGDDFTITQNANNYDLNGTMVARVKVPEFNTTSYVDLILYSPKNLTSEQYENAYLISYNYLNGKKFTQKDYSILEGIGTNSVYIPLTHEFMYGDTAKIVVNWGDGEEITYTFKFNIKVN